jgi:hypothetical protein
VSHSNRNFAIAYLFLVALPITGLVGILRTGRNLKAPTSVDGAWSIEATATNGTISCVNTLGLDRNTPVTISQSGKNFEINAGKAPGAGVIEGTTLQASLRPAGTLPAAANCGRDGFVMLTATVDTKASPQVLAGTLSLPACPACESVEFHAVKQAQKKGAQ